MNQVNHSIKQQLRDFIPFLIKIWIVFDCLVLYLDSFYLANRPETLKGGNLYQYLSFYQLYVDMDPLYGNSPDKFCHLQGYLSGVEATLGFIFLFLNMFQEMRIISAAMTIAVQAFTCWKTVIYIWYSYYFAVPDVINFTTNGIFLYWIPDLIWVVMPLLSILVIGRQMSKYLTSVPAQKPKKA